ncbi:MAG: 30S ribosomal protein S9 [Phycisphaerae bacterium]|nr:30S ribosomal protein S9 [Phycisphaerae bacterium]
MTTKAPVPTIPTAAPEGAPAPAKAAQPADKRGWWWGTGRRKTAVARVRLKPASAGKPGFKITSSGKPDLLRDVNVYFAEERDRNESTAPLVLAGLADKFEVFAVCHGGGYMGQAGAVKLALARALAGYDPTLESRLRDAGMLTRDARKVERKKYGQPGARRRFQFSKR